MRRIAIRFAALGVLCLASNTNPSLAAEKTQPSAAELVAGPGILVIAHRGDSKLTPENTLPAFASALKASADLVELDYYHSADGVPVVFHDADLNRTTNATELWGGSKLKLTSKNLAALKQLDAGSWFAPRFAGTRIPTLVEALDLIQGSSITLIERKGGDPPTCVKLLTEKSLLDRVVVQAFDWDFLAGCNRVAPGLMLAALGEKKLDSARLDQIASTGASIVAWEDKSTDADTIASIHARGWKAWVWTVDDPERIGTLTRAKIDGIITNRPLETRAVLQTLQRAK
jgi:glycerophosphoryl diester phosphodiesterase